MDRDFRWETLGRAIAGAVVLPGSDEYDDVRKPAIPRFHGVRPQAIVRCAGPEDVAETLAFVKGSGLPLAVRNGGHCFAGRSSTSGIVIDVGPMNDVTVDGGQARIGAGARLGDVYDRLMEHGATIPAGCGPTVGITGLTLGGGLGVLGRKHGLTCDSLRAAEVVLADGQVVECDANRHADLFWALRGGGAIGLGVVTALVFDTVEPPVLTSFRLQWSYDHAVTLAMAWQEWTSEAPYEMAASLMLSVPPDMDEPPVAVIFGTMIGTESDTTGLLDRLVHRTGASPETTAVQQASHRDTKRQLVEYGIDHGDLYSFHKSGFLPGPLPKEIIESLVTHLPDARVPGEPRELDFMPWGGAYNAVRDDATAFPHRNQQFLLKQTVNAEPAGKEAALQWLYGSHKHTEAWESGVYPNFRDPELGDGAYYGGNLPRLLETKAAYDPAGRW